MYYCQTTRARSSFAKRPSWTTHLRRPTLAPGAMYKKGGPCAECRSHSARQQNGIRMTQTAADKMTQIHSLTSGSPGTTGPPAPRSPLLLMRFELPVTSCLRCVAVLGLSVSLYECKVRARIARVPDTCPFIYRQVSRGKGKTGPWALFVLVVF